MEDNVKTLLSADGRSEWKIVISKEASASEKHAAQELQTFFEQVSGAALPIIDDSTAETAHEIQLGFSSRTKRLAPEIKGLGPDGLIIRTEENRLLLVGGAPRGVLYAVYEFLEDYLGCRWLTPKVNKIPKRRRVEIPSIDIKYVPPLEYRDNYNFGPLNGDFAARIRSNGEFSKLLPKHGGAVRYNKHGFVHTFESLLPVGDYFETHPEYFSLVNGVRLKERTQLCLTNPDVLKIATEKVLQWIKDDPDAKIVSVSQNDWYNACECENCRAIDEHEGSHSGTLLHFVNKIAAVVSQKYPDIKIDTLAYQYTRRPPKYVRPAENVIVRLCSIECCFTHPFEECSEICSGHVLRADAVAGATFFDDLIGWSKISNQLYVWDYVVNFAHLVMPFPNFQVLAPNIRALIRNHATGIFEEGNGYSIGGEMEPLRAYVISKLLWKPERDTDALINEFLAGYYGMAAGPIRSYIDMLQDKVRDIHMGIYEPPTAPYLTPDILDKADALFDKAETLAADEEILKRVRLARLPIEYVQMATKKKDDPGRADAIEHFFGRVKEEGITVIKEWRTIEEARKLIETAD